MNTHYDIEDVAGLVAKRAGIVLSALVLLIYASINRAIPEFWVWFCGVSAGIATWATVSTVYTPYLLRKYFPPAPPPAPERAIEPVRHAPQPNGHHAQLRPMPDVNAAEIIQRVAARRGETGEVDWPDLLRYVEERGRGRFDTEDLDEFSDSGEALLKLLTDLGAIVTMSIAGGISAYSLSSQAVAIVRAVAENVEGHESLDVLSAILH